MVNKANKRFIGNFLQSVALNGYLYLYSFQQRITNYYRMLLIQTKVQPTQIDNDQLGLFTLVDIPKGEKYWIRYEKFDKVISLEDLDSYEPIIKEYVINYGFQETETRWYLCGDNARFTNDSEHPNTAQHFDEERKLQFCYALRDIKAGEEILCDYQDLCLTMKDSPPPWRK